MTNQDDMIKLIKSISGQANILTIPRVYIGFTKSHRAALFLSQCVYWSDRSCKQDGWFYKSFREWRDELGLNQHAVEYCVKVCLEGGWLETKIARVGIRDTSFYRPNLEKIAESIQSTLAATANVAAAKVRKQPPIRSSIKQKLPPDTKNNGAEKPPRPRDLLFDAISQVTQTDPATAGPSIAKVKKSLLKAHPPYTPAEVLKFGALWPKWKDRPPTLWQLKEQIGIVRNGVQHESTTGSTSTGNRPDAEPTPEQRAAADRINARRAEKQALRGG